MNTAERTPSRHPRTKARRRLAAAGGFAIVLLLIFVLVAYTGDPVTKHLAMNTAETYANETYPGYDIRAVAASARHWFRYEVIVDSSSVRIPASWWRWNRGVSPGIPTMTWWPMAATPGAASWCSWTAV